VLVLNNIAVGTDRPAALLCLRLVDPLVAGLLEGRRMSLRVVTVMTNSKGSVIAAIGWDGDRGEWRINIYGAHGFSTEQAALDFWHANFDHETGTFIGRWQTAS